MKLAYTFGCPVCRKRFTHDEPGEPCCTGPSEMRDDHEMVVMHLLAVRKTEVDPAFAETRAAGALLMPHMEQEVQREALILKC